MPYCAVPVCCSRSSAKSIRQREMEKHMKISFHRFPKVDERKLIWFNAMGLDSTTVCKTAYICSLHFAEECFDRTSLACVRLRDDAIPSISQPRGIPEQCPKYRGAYRMNTTKQPCITSISDETSLPLRSLTSDRYTQTSDDSNDLAMNGVSNVEKGSNILQDRLTRNNSIGTLLHKAMKHHKDKSRKLIRTLQQRNRRQCKKIAQLKSMLRNKKSSELKI